MSIKNNFNLSFEQMWKHKIVAMPYFVTATLTFALLMIFVLSSGFYPVLQYSSAIDAQYAGMDLFGTDADSVANRQAYEQEQDNINNMIFELMTFNNIVFFIAVLLVIIIISIYGQCMAMLLTARVAKGKNPDLDSAWKETWSYFFRFIGYQICFALIFAVPITAVILLAVVAGIINNTLGTIVLVICILALIAYAVYASTKLIFGLSILFMEDMQAVESMKKSYNVTTGRFNEAFLVGLIVGLIMIAFALIGNNFGFDANAISIAAILGLIMMLIFYVLNSFASAFVQLFLMNSYTDFKSPVTAEKKTVAKQTKPKKKAKRK